MQNPLWLCNPEEMSPEIQNSGLQKGHVSAKKNFTEKIFRHSDFALN